MWIFAKTGFVSIVQHNTREDMLVVRARVRIDLDNFLKAAGSKARIDSQSGTDYAFRVVLPRPMVARALVRLADNLNYTNFKDAVHDNSPRDQAYMSCWNAMREFQDDMDPKAKAQKQQLWYDWHGQHVKPKKKASKRNR